MIPDIGEWLIADRLSNGREFPVAGEIMPSVGGKHQIEQRQVIGDRRSYLAVGPVARISERPSCDSALSRAISSSL